MNQAAQIEPQGPVSHVPAPVSETAAVMSLIERAARDPSFDLDKLDRLMAMREKIAREAAERAFNSAMKAAQAEMRPVSTDAENPQTRSRYATYAKLDKALRPIYTKHGFALSFDEADSPKPEHIRVLCYVTHEAGFARTYRKDMPADGKGAKGGDVMTKTHATGAAASYGSRYLLKGIFNVAVGDDDDDGNAAEGLETISQIQAAELVALCDEVGADKRAFCEYFKIGGIAMMPVKDFNRAKTALNKKRSAK